MKIDRVAALRFPFRFKRESSGDANLHNLYLDGGTVNGQCCVLRRPQPRRRAYSIDSEKSVEVLDRVNLYSRSAWLKAI